MLINLVLSRAVSRGRARLGRFFSLRKKPIYTGSGVLIILLLGLVFLIRENQSKIEAVGGELGLVSERVALEISGGPLVFQKNTLAPVSETYLEPAVVRKIRVVVTAYSSTPWETDDTPYITASGTWVRQGIVAANFLPFGTRIRIPEVYNEEVFEVEDRMHPRNWYHVDIWFPSYWEAKNFGAQRTYIEVLEG